MPWISNNGRKSPKFMLSSIPNTKIYKTMSSYVYFDMIASFLLSLYAMMLVQLTREIRQILSTVIVIVLIYNYCMVNVDLF